MSDLVNGQKEGTPLSRDSGQRISSHETNSQWSASLKAANLSIFSEAVFV